MKFSGWFRIIAQAGRVEFTAAKSEGMKPIILVSCLVDSSKFKWSFFEHLTAKTRQAIGRVKFDFKTFAVCSIPWMPEVFSLASGEERQSE